MFSSLRLTVLALCTTLCLFSTSLARAATADNAGQIRAVATSYYRDFYQHHDRAACRLMTVSVQRTLARNTHLVGKPATCSTGFSEITVDTKQRFYEQELHLIASGSVTFSGNQAMISTIGPEFSYVDGRWLVSFLGEA